MGCIFNTEGMKNYPCGTHVGNQIETIYFSQLVNSIVVKYTSGHEQTFSDQYADMFLSSRIIHSTLKEIIPKHFKVNYRD